MLPATTSLSAVFLALLFLVAGSTARAAETFRLADPHIFNGSVLSEDRVFNGFGCTGKKLSPALTWSNPPKGVKSLALTLHDPDAPTGSGWWHWVVFDIPATARSLPLNAAGRGMLPAGAVESLTDFGAPGYGGACPPLGDKAHHYIFTLYGLDIQRLGLDVKAMPAQVGFALHDKVLGKATLTARYAG